MMILLALSFLLLASILGYIVIQTKLNPIIKAVLIVVMIWYSIALYSAPGHFMGWSKPISVLPENSIILAYRIVEPSKTTKGGMYFWVLDPREGKDASNPREFFKLVGESEPRYYCIPYDRELHKQLEEAEKTRKRNPNGLMIWSKGNSHKADRNNEDGDRTGERGFKIKNPVDLLPEKG
jgi:type IV secretory pathway VirB6-like protein